MIDEFLSKNEDSITQEEVVKFLENASPEVRAEFEEGIFLLENPDYRFKPASFAEFVSNPKYLGETQCYRSWLSSGNEIFNGDKHYNEITLLVGIGGGKSYFVALALLYIVHKLLCMKDPRGFYGLSRDKPITILNMGLSAEQARRVVFESVRNFFAKTPWFKQFEFNALKKSLMIDSGKIEMISGNSKGSTPLGLNVFASVLDEADFLEDASNENIAKDLFEGLAARASSRFGKNGYTLAISSPNHAKGYMSERTDKANKFSDTSFGIRFPTYMMKDREKMEEEVFLFDTNTFQTIMPVMVNGEFIFEYLVEFGSKKVKEKRVVLTLGEKEIKSLLWGQKILDEKLFIIPMDFYEVFRKNPEKSARDIACYVEKTSEIFIKRPSAIKDAMTLENKFDGLKWDLENPPKVPVYIHLDLSLNRTDRSDAAGMAVAYCCGHDQFSQPLIRVFGLESIRSGFDGEIQFADVRERIIQMVKHGWIIGLVSLDGYQSIDFMQILNSYNILTDYLSVDRNMEPYNVFKEGIYMKTCEIADSDLLYDEMEDLLVVKGRKVDHPKGGSKDLADAAAGAYYNCYVNSGGGSSFATSRIDY